MYPISDNASDDSEVRANEPDLTQISRDEALRDLPMDEELEEGPLEGPPLQSRRDARELVLKILYATEVTDGDMKVIAKEFIPDVSEKYSGFAMDLCNKIEDGAEQLDELIVEHSEKWDFNRIAMMDRIILRMAIAEIIFFEDIPPKVTINEAIEIAKVYSTKNSSRFVNGILDAIFNELKKKKNFPSE